MASATPISATENVSAFRRAWQALAEKGEVDGWGSAACMRAAEQWIAEHHPGDMVPWLRDWASRDNKGPKKAEIAKPAQK